MSQFANASEFPFCKGCGHHHIARNTIQALEKLGLQPLDVILVTDIGCHGIVDRCFTTHTIHGLHGRSVAFGSGMAMALPAGKKVIAFIGDGGATIGIQHILEAARLNIDMTVVVHNNMVYGITGGQSSSLTPCGFRTSNTPEGNPFTHHDLCKLTHEAGAIFTARLIGNGDFSETLRRAIEIEGFSLVEILEICPSHAIKLNPDLRLQKLAKESDYELGAWLNPLRPTYRLTTRTTNDLLEIPAIAEQSSAKLDKPFGLVLSGSAGEGVQTAAELLAQAAIAASLHVTKKSNYAVTIQVGFSTADIILSPEPILCHAFSHPDAALITSGDGLQDNLERLKNMTKGTVWIDASLPLPKTRANIHRVSFRKLAGNRNAALFALLIFVQETEIIPLTTMLQTIKNSPYGKHIKPELLKRFN